MTLLQDDWDSSRFVVECALRAGFSFDEERGFHLYRQMVGRAWPEFQTLNLTRDAATCDRFWDQLTSRWLSEMGLPSDPAPVARIGRRRLFSPAGDVFTKFVDTDRTLAGLRSRGYRLAVLSNWDQSLHRILAVQGLTGYFEVVIASLEEGVEKPERFIYEVLLERLGCAPEEVLHVGDNPVDDVEGATDAGLHALLLNPNGERVPGQSIRSLGDLLEG